MHKAGNLIWGRENCRELKPGFSATNARFLKFYSNDKYAYFIKKW